MVIAKGEEWGERVRQSDVVYTRNDHDVLTLLASPIKGDIARTIGNDKRKPSIAEKLKTDGAWHQLPFDVIEAGELGYCRFLKFKCAAARTCDAWVVGGPITDEKNDKQA